MSTIEVLVAINKITINSNNRNNSDNKTKGYCYENYE